MSNNFKQFGHKLQISLQTSLLEHDLKASLHLNKPIKTITETHYNKCHI